MKKETKKAEEKKEEKKPEEKKLDQKAQEEMAAVVKEIEGALFAVKFYPVAVDEKSKNEALVKLKDIYAKGNDTVKQLFLYMMHEILAQSSDLKLIHTQEYFRAKHPTMEPAQLRMNVYRAMFNYHTSLEGLGELIKMLGELKGSDDSAKLLTYHFSHLCGFESEANHMLRAVIIESLGKSESLYALKALLEYARYNDNERTLNRIVNALVGWEGRVDGLKISEEEKQKLRARLQEIMTREKGGTHYG